MRISDWSSDVCSSDLDYPINLFRGQAIDGLAPARARHFQEVNDLRYDLGVGGVMHLPDQLAMPRDEVIRGQPQQRPGLVGVDGGRLHHDESDIALGIADIAVDDRLVDDAVLARSEEHT